MSETQENTRDFDFSAVFSELNSRTRKECSRCGETFRGTEDEEICPQCEFRAAHPEEQDKYWTWTRFGREWGITAYWPDREPLPDPGDRVTVHRKDGSTATATVREMPELRYLPDGRGRVYCWVENRAP